MKIFTTKAKNILRVTLYSGVFMVLGIVIVFFLFVSIYYKADIYAKNLMIENQNTYFIHDNFIVFNPECKSDIGFIFYPGGKVEAIAYAPLLKQLSDKGITTVLVKMPFNLAVFGINRADNVFDQLPHINNWFIGGHSLGGAMASSYAKNNTDKLQGLILLGAYPVNELDLDTLTLYGSNDNIINRNSLKAVENRISIEGGNHAYFGNYGEQSGDGIATITREEQLNTTIDIILQFIDDVIN